MIFSSINFLFIFLPIALLGFHLLSMVSHRAAAAWLAAASLAFYAAWRPIFLPILLVSIAFNYGVGQMLARWADRPTAQRVVFSFAIAANILALFYFKYIGAVLIWFGLRDIAGGSFGDITLPLGISFFTFTQIGYIVDVRDKVAPTGNPLSYVLFVTFFPHLIAGPILHNREMVPQFGDPKVYRFSAENTAIGLTILIGGLAKKVVLADPLAYVAQQSFGHTGSIGLLQAWYGVIVYSFQLYFDFSGYSDMAIGVARMFNINFPLNFASPFRSRSIIDFWQRWHMTLTRFITMYIFNPIAMSIARSNLGDGRLASRKAIYTLEGFTWMLVVPTMITMSLAGIWHGAGLQFLIFGFLHGTYIVINHAARTVRSKRQREGRASSSSSSWGRAAMEWALVYIGVLVSFCFFRASSTGSALQMLGAMAGMNGIGHLGVSAAFVIRTILLAGIIWIMPNTQQIMARYRPALGRIEETGALRLTWAPTRAWAMAAAILAGMGLVWLGSPSEFLYFQF